MKLPLSILVIGDDVTTESVEKGLRDTNPKLHIIHQDSIEKALGLLESEHYDLIVSTYGTDDMDGSQLVKSVKAKCRVPLLIIQKPGDEDGILSDLTDGLDFYLIQAGKHRE